MSPDAPEPPRFLTDRNLGARVVPNLLRAAGFDVTTLQERYGIARAERVSDEEWLADAGHDNLIVLMKDKRIRRTQTLRSESP